jgi:hypothetical protein
LEKRWLWAGASVVIAAAAILISLIWAATPGVSGTALARPLEGIRVETPSGENPLAQRTRAAAVEAGLGDHGEPGWYTETVDSAGNVGQYSSLALDDSGSLHIAYYDASRGRLKYAYHAGGRPHAVYLPLVVRQ